jgi:hypothetical protein
MSASLLFPLDQIRPSQFLSQYSEWIYFTLLLVFFLSVAGIALRKHFDKPYVKPLIISVSLMITIGLFKFRNSLTTIFESWGILGTVLLIIIGAAIPFGLSRSFGLSAAKSFFIAYVLFYILSWLQFPQIYYFLAEKNLGLVNLGLLVLFLVAIIRLVKFGKWAPKMSTNLNNTSTYDSEIGNEIGMQGVEKSMIKKQAERITKIEIRTIDDIVQFLEQINQVIEKHRNNLPLEERDKISNILKEIVKKEQLFKKALLNLHKVFKRISVFDVNQIEKQKKRMAGVDEKERRILKAEIVGEEEKLKIEKAIFGFEEKLNRYVDSFNKYLGTAMDHLRASPHPYDVKPYLSKAQLVLKEISEMLKEIKTLGEQLVGLSKTEERLLKKEKQTA